MLPKISFLKRVLSYLYPQRIKYAQGMGDAELELLLYQGEWQLGSGDALYSDGTQYRPLVAAFDVLKEELPFFKTVLVLGAGIGSAVMILNKRGLHPAITLLDHDKISLEWALELFDADTLQRIDPVCADAKAYMQANTKEYDLVIVDIFKGREVPAFVTSTDFLNDCKRSMSDSGAFVMNYIENKVGEWASVIATVDSVFPENSVVKFGINRVIVAS